MLKSQPQSEKLTNKNMALLKWVLCETGVENYTFDQKQCVKLYNDYLKIDRENTNYNKSQKEE